MVTILHAVEYASPGGIQRRSQNERTFYSAFHPPGGNFKIDASQSQKRARAIITIYNERRPYTIVIKYVIQERSSGSYRKVGEDDVMANKIKKRFLTYLATRPEKSDFVDDFRAF